MLRDLLAVFLARSGRVIVAEGGRQALELARRQPPDLMIVDLFMPDLDGEAVCRAVKNDPDLGHIPVVVLVASESPEDRARVLRAGAADVLHKPIDRITLMETTRRFLRASPARGLPRVDFHHRVRVTNSSGEAWVQAENLSRGGIYIEAEEPLPLRAEVQLEFSLPEASTPITPTAEVVWLRRATNAPAGMGLRFLGLDGQSFRALSDYVQERAVLPIEGSR